MDVVLGAQFGDEGKGKLVDLMAWEGAYDVTARCQGGSNAGHTIVVDGVSYDFHLVPSGILNPKSTCLIGHGVVVHLPSLFSELKSLSAKGLDWKGRLFISDRAHLVFDFHQIVDGLKEAELGGSKIGTTKRGIGPAYSSKASRSGIRMHHLFDENEFEKRFRSMVLNKQKRFGGFDYDVEGELSTYKEYAKTLQDMVIDGVAFLNAKLESGARVLVEGANALMLDIDVGTYPYVTSSNTCIGGVFTGLGVSPRFLNETIGVIKAYTTRVGSGPFATEELGQIGEFLGEKGHEFGTTTGRKRRCGWLDLVLCRYSCLINGYTAINLTKLDVLSGLAEIQVAVAYKLDGKVLAFYPADASVLDRVEIVYEKFPGWSQALNHCKTFEELPKEAQSYVLAIESFLKVPVKFIGVGPGRDELIVNAGSLAKGFPTAKTVVGSIEPSKFLVSTQ